MRSRILDIVTYSLAACIVIDSSIIAYNIINLQNGAQLSVRPLVFLGLVHIDMTEKILRVSVL